MYLTDDYKDIIEIFNEHISSLGRIWITLYNQI